MGGDLFEIIRTAFQRFGFEPDPAKLVVYLPETSLRTGNRVWALLGSLFPSGSLKFISVLGMLSHLARTHHESKIKNVIASTSGNTGLACASLLQGTPVTFHAIIDARTAPGKKEVLKSLGAKVIEIEKPEPTYIAARLRKAEELTRSLPDAIDLDQYGNPGALEGHFTFTGPLLRSIRRADIDIFVAPIGTGGIFGGTAHYLRSMNPRVATVPVDCEGSIVLGGPQGHHLLTGLGAHVRCNNALRAYPAMAGIRPRIIGDRAAFFAAHWVREHDGIWVGGSSGAALAAICEISRDVQGKDIVLVCPDGGESYHETIFNLTWLASQGMNFNLKGAQYA